MTATQKQRTSLWVVRVHGTLVLLTSAFCLCCMCLQRRKKASGFTVLQVRTDGSTTPSQTGARTLFLHAVAVPLPVASSHLQHCLKSIKRECMTCREFWWPSFPVLVYFKVRCAAAQSVTQFGTTVKAGLSISLFMQETQTEPEGQVRPGIIMFCGLACCMSHAVTSACITYLEEALTHAQIHFFPIIFNGKQLYDVMAERCGTSQNSGKQ